MGWKIALSYLGSLTVDMGVALSYGFAVGDFWVDGRLLLDNPWGIVSLVDVYVGFLFFIGWIWYREECLSRKLFWSVWILFGGNLLAGIYALSALLKSKGDASLFFLGTQARFLKSNPYQNNGFD